MPTAHLVLSRSAPTMNCNTRGEFDVLSGLIEKPEIHSFLRLSNPKYNGALARILDHQPADTGRIRVRLVIGGDIKLVKPSAIPSGAERSRLVSDAIITTISVHMLHIAVGAQIDSVLTAGIDAIGISLSNFDAYVADMVNRYTQLFEPFSTSMAASQRTGMAEMLQYVRNHQKHHGRILAEIFVLYKTISEDDRKKVNENALQVNAQLKGSQLMGAQLKGVHG